MNKITGLLRVLLTPSCWMRVGKYSTEWDLEFTELMENHTFEGRKEYSVQLGPVRVWLGNHPYASFSSFKYDGQVVCGPLPKRITVLRAMDKLRCETTYCY